MEKNEVHITVRNIKTGEVLMDKTPAAFICVAVDERIMPLLKEITAYDTGEKEDADA